jgi:hypothetical protein
MHPNQQSAAMALTARPPFNVTIESFPTAKVEVTHAEVGAVCDFKGLLERREEELFNVVENAWHLVYLDRVR